MRGDGALPSSVGVQLPSKSLTVLVTSFAVVAPVRSKRPHIQRVLESALVQTEPADVALRYQARRVRAGRLREYREYQGKDR